MLNPPRKSPFENSGFYDSGNTAIQRMADFWQYAYPVNQVYWSDADIDNRVYAGQVDVWNSLYPNIPLYRRNIYNFNRSMRAIHMVDGRQRQYRKRLVATPVENGSEHTADQFTKIIEHIANKGHMFEMISDAFKEALISGICWLQVVEDYRNDPVSGDIKIVKRSYNEVLADPYFRNPDLSDCNGLYLRSYITHAEAMSLYPNHSDEINTIQVRGGKDAKFQFIPEQFSFSKSTLLACDEFYYRDYREQRLLMDHNTGETMEWKSDDEDKLKFFLQTYPEVSVTKQEIPTVRQTIALEGHPVYDGPLFTDRYTLVPVFCYYNPSIPYYNLRLQSMIRNIRDIQYLYSRRKVIELDMLEARVQTGWIYKESALIDPDAVYYTGQGKNITLKESANMTDIIPIPSQTIDPSIFQASDYLGNEINQVLGINEELLGSADDSKAGVLAMLRQGAGLTTLQGLFDSLDRSQQILGTILVDAIQANYTPGKIQRIIKEKPSQEFYNKAFGQYDIVIEDGFNTATQRQMQFAQLMELRGLGVNIPDDILINAATIQNKKQLTDILKSQQESQQQQQQQQSQVAMQEQEARINLSNARATADQGLGIERMSRVQENHALAIERKAQSEKDHFSALLDFVKAIKELEGMDIKNIQDIIALTKIVSASSQEKEFTPNALTQPQVPAEQPQQQQFQGLDALKGLG